MSYFDESAPYWGSSIEPMGDAENTRLSARSVKIFADGEFYPKVNDVG